MATKIPMINILNQKNAERSCSVGRMLDWGLKGCWFEPHRQRSHCVVSLSSVFIRCLLSTILVQSRKTHLEMTEKLLTGM